MRRSDAIEELIPWLYLKGVSTGDFSEALQTIVGERAKGLSANVVVRLKEQWAGEYDEWCKRDLSGKHYVYIRADGIHVKVRLEDDANKTQCILVVMGATADGKKELIAVLDGYRETEQSWSELLLGLKQRGLAIAVGTIMRRLQARQFLESLFVPCWFLRFVKLLAAGNGGKSRRPFGLTLN